MYFSLYIAAATVLATQAGTTGARASGPYTTNSYDGAGPRSGLVLSGKTLYGTAAEHSGAWGGASGTIFKVDTDGSNFAVLHYFSPISYPNPTNSDGGCPVGGLVLSDRTLFGTASQGGTGASGTVFEINIDGKGFTVLHTFAVPQRGVLQVNSDGACPLARLALSGNTLYGTTQRGGNNNGTVFKINTDGSGFATLHTFARRGSELTNWDGFFPETELLVSHNTIYGTAWSGGPAGNGTVFKLNTNGTGFTVLHSLIVSKGPSGYNNQGRPCNVDGAYPEAGLVLLGATLYGTAHTGGLAGNGTVFKLNTDGTDFTVLHSFTAHGNSSPDITNWDGEAPKGLLLYGDSLYGIASNNGRNGGGTLFHMKTDGTGFEVLHSFGGSDGSSPQGTVLLSGDGLYGTARFGGGKGGGTVFKVKTNGSGFAVLHRFTKESLPPGLTD